MTAPATIRPTVDAAYEYCESVTRKAASNFYWGFRLLPGERRRGLTAVYAFCRAADDIADEPHATPARLIERRREDFERFGCREEDVLAARPKLGRSDFARLVWKELWA